MKILFINSKKFDYGQDLAFAGLAHHVGTANIRDFPFNPNYHLNLKGYPKNLGNIGSKSLLHYAAQVQITPESADLVIVGSAKPDAFQTYLQIQEQISSTTPVALIDGGDREELGGDLIRLNAFDLWNRAQAQRPFDLIFKREYLKGRTYPSHVHPLPFSMNLEALKAKPNAQKNKQVCFWAMNSHPVRAKAFEILKGKFDCDENGTGPSPDLKAYQYKGRRYHEELAKCKIVISLRGGGWDTLRYWEVPALGPLMISTELDIVIPNDFENRKHIVRCREDLSDLIELCEYYLRHDDEREQIAAAGREHLLKHHTPAARAKEILRIVGEWSSQK